MDSLSQILQNGDKIYRLRAVGSKGKGGVAFKIEDKENRELYRGVVYGNTIVPIEPPETDKSSDKVKRMI